VTYDRNLVDDCAIGFMKVKTNCAFIWGGNLHNGQYFVEFEGLFWKPMPFI
jgi:hypothetical protein